MIRVGIDAMGGDYAPLNVVQGAIDSLEMLDSQSRLVLFGDQEAIEKIFADFGFDNSQQQIEIVNASEVIGMSDHPAQAFSSKQNSSITQGFMHLAKGKIDGFASAGNTGAMMVGSVMVIKAIEGVLRPTIATPLLTQNGRYALIMDVGLNSDCKPEVLEQYGLIGSLFYQKMYATENPRIALLNIGEEEGKGNLVVKASYALMKESKKYNFVGNVEGNHILDGSIADVVITDGFTGNVVLKMAESFYEMLKNEDFSKHPVVESFNYEMVGGTPVLGINSNVVIGHGHSSPRAITNMILITEKTIRSGFVESLKQSLK